MIDFEPIDEDTGIEDYPGYIGMTWDGELSMSKEFKDFENFDWNTYSELIEELNESRYLDYQFRNLNNHVTFEAYQDIGFLVDGFITVEVHNDDGSSYGGMASGRGYIFFLRAGFNLVDAIEEFNAVAIALSEDLKSISS
jgi:hypothetical protein